MINGTNITNWRKKRVKNYPFSSLFVTKSAFVRFHIHERFTDKFICSGGLGNNLIIGRWVGLCNLLNTLFGKDQLFVNRFESYEEKSIPAHIKAIQSHMY